MMTSQTTVTSNLNVFDDSTTAQKTGELQIIQSSNRPPSLEWGSRGMQQKPQAHMTEQSKPEASLENGGLNSEEIEKLRRLLGSLHKPFGASSLIFSGISSCPSTSDNVHATS